MLHTMQARVVTRTNRRREIPFTEVHKVYYFCPSMIKAQNVKDVEAYIEAKIFSDIDLFLLTTREWTRDMFKIEDPNVVPTKYIG